MIVLYLIFGVAAGNLLLGYLIGAKWGAPLGSRARAPLPNRATPVAPPAVAAAPRTAPLRPVEASPPALASAPPQAAVVADSVQDFMLGAQQLRERIHQIEPRVRNCAAEPSTPEVAACADALRSAGEHYLQQSHETSARLPTEQELPGELAAISQKLNDCVAVQTRQVAASQAELAALDLAAPPERNCEALLGQTTELKQGATLLQQELTHVQEELVERFGGSLPSRAPRPKLDQPTDRKTLESVLRERIMQGVESAAPQILGLIAVDHRTRTGPIESPQVALDLVRQFLQLISAAAPDVLVSLFDEQRIAVLFTDCTTSHAVAEMERLRQQLEAAAFTHAGDPLQVNATCALARLKPNDTVESLFGRLTSTLAESPELGPAAAL